MATEPIQSALPKGPTGATGAQDVNGQLHWHDAAGKDLGAVEGADSDFSSMGTAAPTPDKSSQSESNAWADFGVAAPAQSATPPTSDWASFGVSAPHPESNDPQRGAAQATGISATPKAPENWLDKALLGPNAGEVRQWWEDLKNDIHNGTGATSVGRMLQIAGAKGTSYGEPEGVASGMTMGPAAVPTIVHGLTKVATHPIQAANEVFAGTGQAFGPLMVSQPEALPFIAAGMVGQHAGTEVAKAFGADDDSAELTGNVVGLLTGGLTTEHGRASVGAAGDVAKRVAGKIADSITESKVGDKVGAVLGRTSDFNTAVRRISEPTRKQFGGYVEKIENVSDDLQHILNTNKGAADSPAAFADAINKHIEESTKELGTRAGATKESAEPVVPKIAERIDKAMDDFFDENKGRYGSPEQVEAAKQNVRNRLMQEKGAHEPGDPLERREPNMFEAENLRKGFNDASKGAPGMPEGANEAAARVANETLRPAIDEGYLARGVDNVAEVRQKQADLIDIRDKIRDAQQKAEDMGQPGILKSLTKKIGTPGVVIALALGHPVSAAGVGAAVLGDRIFNNLKNPNVNLGRAADLAARNPGATATELQNVVPPATPAPVPAELPPPVDHALHADLATAFHTTVGESDPVELKNRFLDGLRRRQAEAQAAGKQFEPTPKEEATLKSINVSDAKARQTEYDNQVKLAEAAKATAEKQAKEQQKAAEKAAQEAAKQKAEAEAKRLESVRAAHDADKARDAAEDEPEMRLTPMESHILPHDYEVVVEDGEGNRRTETTSSYSHQEALKNVWDALRNRGEDIRSAEVTQELPREEKGYSVPTDKIGNIPGQRSQAARKSLIEHELGHVFANHINGVDSYSIVSNTHPAMKGHGGLLAAMSDMSPFTEDDGSFSRKSVGNNLPKIMESWMGGIAADELFNDTPRSQNPNYKLVKGIPTDRTVLHTMLTDNLGLTDNEATTIVNNAIDSVKEKLDNPVTRGIIKENSPFREEGLKDTYHYSPERLERMKTEHDARMAEHDFEQRKQDRIEQEARDADEERKANAAADDESAVAGEVRGGQPKLESEGPRGDGGSTAERANREAEGGKREDEGTVEERPQVKYKPSEKAVTLSAERPNYGPEFDEAQTQHEIDRNKKIIRNPQATDEDRRVARENLFNIQNPDLNEAQRTALAAVGGEKSEVAQAADEFNATKGRAPIETGTTHSPETAQRIAKAFEEMKHEPENPKVKASYDAAKKDIDDQWNYATQKMGVKFEPWTKEGQPYANSKEMVADVKDNKHLYFFQGGEMPADHPLATVDPQTGLTYNDKLRAVHDLFGHAANENQFGPKGEENAWNDHRQMFSSEALPAITSETRGQNSWVNAGEHLRVPFKEGRTIPAERTTGESAIDEAIKAGGGVPGGRMADAGLGLDLSMFHDPTTGSTLALKTSEGVTPAKVREKLAASRADYLKAHPEESRIPEKDQPGYVPPAERPFAQQKAGLLPEEFYKPNGAKDWAEIDLKANPAGGIDPNTGSTESKRVGFEIYPEARQVLEHPPTPADFKAYAAEHADILKQHPDLKIGWDTTGAKPELNIGISTDNAAAAKRVAAKLDQRAAWDTQKNEEIPTGGKGEQTSFPDYPFEQRLTDLEEKGMPQAAVAQTVVRPKGSTVDLHENPLTIKGTGETGQPTTIDVAQALNKFSRKQNPALELSKAEPAEMVERAKSLAEDEARYQLAQNNNGAAWYTTDMKEHDGVLQDMRPELSDPNKLSMFKMVEAVLSSGQKPYGNLKAAVKAWDAYHETGKFPETNPETGKSWGPRGMKAYGDAISHINRLIAEKGEEGASQWLLSEHPVKELKEYNPWVRGKADDKQLGALVLGPKRGPFAQNLHGQESAFTADMWVARTWNRWMGTIETDPNAGLYGEVTTDAPRSDKERNLMKQSFAETADKLKMSTSALQAVLWYYEQALYSAHGSAKESWSFSDAAKRARDEEDSTFKFGNNATEVK